MINARCSSRLGGERSGGQRVRRWFVLSAMRSGRSISKLTGRNISFWGSFRSSSLAARECVVAKVTCYGCAQVTALQGCDRTKTLTRHSGMQGARNSPAISMP